MEGSPCLAGLVFSASLASRHPRPAPSCHTLSGSFRKVQGGNGSVTGNGKRGGQAMAARKITRDPKGHEDGPAAPDRVSHGRRRVAD